LAEKLCLFFVGQVYLCRFKDLWRNVPSPLTTMKGPPPGSPWFFTIPQTRNGRLSFFLKKANFIFVRRKNIVELNK
jgi:hypothetical protein